MIEFGIHYEYQYHRSLFARRNLQCSLQFISEQCSDMIYERFLGKSLCEPVRWFFSLKRWISVTTAMWRPQICYFVNFSPTDLAISILFDSFVQTLTFVRIWLIWLFASTSAFRDADLHVRLILVRRHPSLLFLELHRAVKKFV
jgi:hypothetical protein